MLNDWLEADDVEAIEIERRAVDAWRRIGRASISISVITSDKRVIPEQVVRIEYDERQFEKTGMTTRTGTNKVTVFGVKGHPTQPDTDLRRGDEFVYENARYRIVSVSQYPGEIQALSEIAS